MQSAAFGAVALTLQEMYRASVAVHRHKAGGGQPALGNSSLWSGSVCIMSAMFCVVFVCGLLLHAVLF